MKLGVKITLTPAQIQAIYADLEELKEGYKNRILRVAAERGSRRTVGVVRTAVASNRSSGATYQAIGSKVTRIPGKSIYIGLVGARAEAKFTVTHPLFGYRPVGAYRQDTPGRNTPYRIAHFLEGGRGSVSPKNAKGLLVFVVDKLDERRKQALIFSKTKRERSKSQSYTGKLPKQYRVKNGYLVFVKGSVKPATGVHPIEKSQPEFERNITNALLEASDTELKRLAGRAAARGSSLYRS